MDLSREVVVIERGLYVGLEVIGHILGIDSQKWYNYAYNKGLQVEKRPHPDDGRKKVYRFGALIPFFEKSRKGEMKWSEDAHVYPANDEVHQAYKKACVDASFELDPNWSREVADLFDMCVGDVATPTETATDNASSMNMASASDTTTGIDYLLIGADVPYLREGLTQVHGPDDNFPNPANLNTLLDHVNDICFGHLDETNDQCMKHCKVQGACAIKRRDTLLALAEDEDHKDASLARSVQVSENFEAMRKRRAKVATNLGDWMDT